MVGRGSLNGLSPIIRIGKGAIMKTVQEWLRETNAAEIIDTYLVEYPIDFQMLEDKKRTVADVLETAKENLSRLIQYLRTMEADCSEDSIFYAVHVRENQFPKVRADLSMQDEICLNVLPEHYAWDFTPLGEGYGLSYRGYKADVGPHGNHSRSDPLRHDLLRF